MARSIEEVLNGARMLLSKPMPQSFESRLYEQPGTNFEKQMGFGFPEVLTPEVGGMGGVRRMGGQVPQRMSFRDMGRLAFMETPRAGRGLFGNTSTLNTGGL